MFSLGGLDENGKNMFVIEVDKNIFVFEAGLKYADELCSVSFWVWWGNRIEILSISDFILLSLECIMNPVVK